MQIVFWSRSHFAFCDNRMELEGVPGGALAGSQVRSFPEDRFGHGNFFLVYRLRHRPVFSSLVGRFFSVLG